MWFANIKETAGTQENFKCCYASLWVLFALFNRWWGCSLVKITLRSEKPWGGPSYFYVTWKQNFLPVRCFFLTKCISETQKRLCKIKKVLTPFSLKCEIGRQERSLQTMSYKDMHCSCGFIFFTSNSQATFLNLQIRHISLFRFD